MYEYMHGNGPKCVGLTGGRCSADIVVVGRLLIDTHVSGVYVAYGVM
jgi:hypothetical protein